MTPPWMAHSAVSRGLASRLRLKRSKPGKRALTPPGLKGPGISSEIETHTHSLQSSKGNRLKGPGISSEIETLIIDSPPGALYGLKGPGISSEIETPAIHRRASEAWEVSRG